MMSNRHICNPSRTTPKLPLIKSLFLLAFMVTQSCAHHNNVRPGENGLHRVVVRAADQEAGEQEALKQARYFCKKHGNKQAVVVNEGHRYTGDMPEEDYKKIKKGAKVAQVVGGTVAVFGGEKESNLGKVVGLGGVAADVATGKGYTVEMQFRCQEF